PCNTSTKRKRQLPRFDGFISFHFRSSPRNEVGAIMTMECAITGKKPGRGYKYARRGKAKYLGGVGKKVTGKTRRRFKPNLQRVKIEINGTVKSVRVC